MRDTCTAPAERHASPTSLSPGAVTLPTHNPAGWLAHWAEVAGDRPAIVDAARRLDFRKFHDRVTRLAGWLRGAGVGPGDRVALLLRNATPALESVLAVAQIGAIGLPINWRFLPREIAFVLADSGARLVIHEAEFEATLSAASALVSKPPRKSLRVGGPGDPYEKCLAATPPDPRIEALSPEAPMTLMYTSGTTGEPKGALLPHRKTLYNARNAERYFGLSPSDRVLVLTPLFHSLALKILSLPALYTGACIVLEDHFDADHAWQTVEREAITFAGGVPTQYQRLLDALQSAKARGEPPRLESLRFLFTAGAAVPAELVERFHEYGLVLIQGYGQTETSLLCCLDEKDARRKAGSVGQPVAHAEIRVVEPATLEADPATWRECGTGEVGEIVVRGPITMLGYWNRPAATRETLRGEWLRTTDLATRDAEGFITLVGRVREMIISGGENVYPAEVEAALLEHPAVREAAVVGVPDPEWGEVGRAHVVLEDGRAVDAETLRAWTLERLARFKVPRDFQFEETLPRTPSGKVMKHQLAGPLADGSKAAKDPNEDGPHLA